MRYKGSVDAALRISPSLRQAPTIYDNVMYSGPAAALMEAMEGHRRISDAPSHWGPERNSPRGQGDVLALSSGRSSLPSVYGGALWLVTQDGDDSL